MTIDYYRDMSDSKNVKVHITDELKAAIAEADTVVGVSVNWGVSALQPTDVQYQSLSTLLEQTHDAGGRFVLLSGNLPYDSAMGLAALVLAIAAFATSKLLRR